VTGEDRRAGLPEDATAIAANKDGDLLIIWARSDEFEFWDHETGESKPVEVDSE